MADDLDEVLRGILRGILQALPGFDATVLVVSQTGAALAASTLSIGEAIDALRAIAASAPPCSCPKCAAAREQQGWCDGGSTLH